jgi:hypothetical protein
MDRLTVEQPLKHYRGLLLKRHYELGDKPDGFSSAVLRLSDLQEVVTGYYPTFNLGCLVGSE